MLKAIQINVDEQIIGLEFISEHIMVFLGQF